MQQGLKSFPVACHSYITYFIKIICIWHSALIINFEFTSQASESNALKRLKQGFAKSHLLSQLTSKVGEFESISPNSKRFSGLILGLRPAIHS